MTSTSENISMLIFWNVHHDRLVCKLLWIRFLMISVGIVAIYQSPMPNQAFAYACGPGVDAGGQIGIPCPPQTRITSAADANGNAVQSGGSTVSTSITFQVTATPGTYPGYPIAGFQCSLDGSAFSSCATNNPATISYNNLAAGGQHTFAVRAVDTQGNTDPNPATFSWTVLTPAPATHTSTASHRYKHPPKARV
jgi:hypothetical protein